MSAHCGAMLAAAALLGAPLPARAQSAERPTAPPVLAMPASTRALALGEAYAAAAGDDALLFYNPAQLAAAGPARASVSGSVQSWAVGVKLGAVVAGRTMGGGRLALGLRVLDYGSEAEIVPDPEFGGERGVATGRDVGASEYVISAGYAHPLGPVRAGLAVGAARQHIAGLDGGAWTFDVGLATGIAGGTLAVALQHAGDDLTLGSTTAPLPTQLRVGLGAPVIALGRLRIEVLGEIVRPRDGDARAAGGAEVRWSAGDVTIAGRAGARAGPTEDADMMRTVGLGVAWSVWRLDWAMQPVDTFGGTSHRVGIRWAR